MLSLILFKKTLGVRIGRSLSSSSLISDILWCQDRSIIILFVIDFVLFKWAYINSCWYRIDYFRIITGWKFFKLHSPYLKSFCFTICRSNYWDCPLLQIFQKHIFLNNYKYYVVPRFGYHPHCIKNFYFQWVFSSKLLKYCWPTSFL